MHKRKLHENKTIQQQQNHPATTKPSSNNKTIQQQQNHPATTKPSSNNKTIQKNKETRGENDDEGARNGGGVPAM
jgi:hypothetical protein